jgi:hypothetical protein
MTTSCIASVQDMTVFHVPQEGRPRCARLKQDRGQPTTEIGQKTNVNEECVCSLNNMNLSKIVQGQCASKFDLPFFVNLLLMFPRIPRKLQSDAQPNPDKGEQHDIHKVSPQDVVVQ